MKELFDLFCGKELQAATSARLQKLTHASALASRRTASELLARWQREAGPHALIGETKWGESVVLPMTEIIAGHSLVTGATNAGKTRLCSIIFEESLKWE